MFKVNNKKHQYFGVFIVNFGHISDLLVFLLLTLNKQILAGYDRLTHAIRKDQQKILPENSKYVKNRSVQDHL